MNIGEHKSHAPGNIKPSLYCFTHFQVDSQVSLLKTSQPQGPSPSSFRCQILHPTQSDLGSQKSYNVFLTHHRPFSSFSFRFPQLTSTLTQAQLGPPFFLHNHQGSCRINARQGPPHPLDRHEQTSQTHLPQPLASRFPSHHCPCCGNKGGKPLEWRPPSSESCRAELEWRRAAEGRREVAMQSSQGPATVTPFEGFEHLLSPGSMWHSAKGMQHGLGSALRAKEGPVVTAAAELFRQWRQPKEPAEGHRSLSSSNTEDQSHRSTGPLPLRKANHATGDQQTLDSTPPLVGTK